jgi:hypothetical protein
MHKKVILDRVRAIRGEVDHILESEAKDISVVLSMSLNTIMKQCRDILTRNDTLPFSEDDSKEEVIDYILSRFDKVYGLDSALCKVAKIGLSGVSLERLKALRLMIFTSMYD